MSERDVLIGLLLSVQASVEAALEVLRGQEKATPEPERDEEGNCTHTSTRTISVLGGADVEICLGCGEAV